MNALHIVELRPDLLALLRFLRGQELEARYGDEDLGYGVHTWLAGAFGKMAPKPWRLLLDRRRPPRILGYARHDAEALRQQMREFADPGAFAVCADPEVAIASRAMPAWRSGRRLGFQLQCCPVGRKAGVGVEKDLFLVRADANGQRVLRRETVYCDWVRDQLQQDQAAILTSIRLDGFRLVRLMRQGQDLAGPRRRSHLIRPQALLQGELTVVDPDAFAALLARGVGRHRAFGYGMLLLRPSS